MTNAPTRVLSQTLALGTDADSIQYTVQDGHPFIVLGNVDVALSLSTQAALDKLATVTAQAAADHRARLLKEVA